MIGRVTSMTYAIICYAIGMASLVYAAGWLIGLYTPTAVDDPSGEFTMTNLAINFGLVLAFALQHSVMARPGFKAIWTKLIPAHAERATYILASAIAMFAMMWYWQPLGVVIWQAQGVASTTLYAIYAIGWAVLVSATFFLNHFDLFGLRQAWLNLRGKAYNHIPFATPGFYRWVRHPIYVGWLLVIWAAPTMTVSHFAFALLTTIYIVAAVPIEERDLTRILPEYDEYKKTTPALIPNFRR